MSYQQLASILKVLSDENRLEILDISNRFSSDSTIGNI
jgi:DNA-binding transcriptional ArsR family regulator